MFRDCAMPDLRSGYGVRMEREGMVLSVSILTFGCAMNFYDTEVAEGILEKAGYRIVTQVPLPKVRGFRFSGRNSGAGISSSMWRWGSEPTLF